MGTVDKALQVLNVLAKRPGEWGVSELARETGQGRSAVHAILQSLITYGYADKDDRSKRYRLGPSVLLLAQSMTHRGDLRQVARSPMQTLAIATGECAYLLVPSGNNCVTIHRSEAPVVFRVTTEVGSFSPLHAASNAKAILAYLSQDRVDRYLSGPLEQVTPFTPVDPDLIRRQLEEVRRLGYSYTENELFEEMAGIAAPIFDGHGEALGSVGIGGLTARVRASREEITKHVVAAATAISASLGYHQPFQG